MLDKAWGKKVGQNDQKLDELDEMPLVFLLDLNQSGHVISADQVLLIQEAVGWKMGKASLQMPSPSRPSPWQN